MKLTLRKTTFDYNLYDRRKIFSATWGNYTYYTIDMWNSIVINDKAYRALYQAGHFFHGNDLNAPTNEMAIYLESSHPLFEILMEIDKKDFQNEVAMKEFLEQIQEIEPAIDNSEKLKELYTLFIENTPVIDADFAKTLDELQTEYGE